MNFCAAMCALACVGECFVLDGVGEAMLAFY